MQRSWSDIATPALVLIALLGISEAVPAQVGIGVGVGRGFGYPGGGYPYWGAPYGYAGRGINPAYTFGYRPEWNYGFYGAPYYANGGYMNRFEAYTPFPRRTLNVYPGPASGFASAPGFFAVPPIRETPTLANTDLLLRVYVPDSAQVWINGALTTQTGTAREYITNDLSPGRAYAYTIRARWMEDGMPVERERKIKVRAGEVRLVNLHVEQE